MADIVANEMAIDIVANEEEAIAESVVPAMDSDNKTRYLAYLACGFRVREALKLAGLHQGLIFKWRQKDERFAEAEEAAKGELRGKLSREYLTIEFTRNFVLSLHADYEILHKTQNDGVDGLTSKEHEYLLKVRSQYTPQQLQIVQQLYGGGDGKQSFADLVKAFSESNSLELSETKRAITITK